MGSVVQANDKRLYKIDNTLFVSRTLDAEIVVILVKFCISALSSFYAYS